MLLLLNRQYECTSFNLVGPLSSVRTAHGIFHLYGPTRFIILRDLKIRGRDELRRLSKVNLHNDACAHESQTRVLAVLVSSRTRFCLFCRRLENVSISRLVFTYNKTQSISFSDMLTMVFRKIIFFTIFVGNISKWGKKAIIYVLCLLLVFCVRDNECSWGCVQTQHCCANNIGTCSASWEGYNP